MHHCLQLFFLLIHSPGHPGPDSFEMDVLTMDEEVDGEEPGAGNPQQAAVPEEDDDEVVIVEEDAPPRRRGSRSSGRKSR